MLNWINGDRFFFTSELKRNLSSTVIDNAVSGESFWLAWLNIAVIKCFLVVCGYNFVTIIQLSSSSFQSRTVNGSAIMQLNSPGGSTLQRGAGRDLLCLSSLANPLMGTLKPHSNGPLYNNTVIGTLAVNTVRRGLAGRAAVPLSPLLAVPNVTAHPSTASVPITVPLGNGLLLCGFNVPIKG